MSAKKLLFFTAILALPVYMSWGDILLGLDIGMQYVNQYVFPAKYNMLAGITVAYVTSCLLFGFLE